MKIKPIVGLLLVIVFLVSGCGETVVVKEGSENPDSLVGQGSKKIVEFVRFYTLDDNAEDIIYETVEVVYNSQDDIKEVLSDKYKEVTDYILTKGTRINKLEVVEGILNIDLSSEFQEEMNAGSGIESMILQSIANTFGNYFDVDKVILTIEGELYSSGHIVMLLGEYI